LNWEEAKEMKQFGFSFYSHTYHSHDSVLGADNRWVDPLTNLIFLKDQNRVETEQEYETRVSSDLAKASQMLKDELGNQLDMLCYPHGRSKETLVKLANKEGIQYFFTGNDGLNSTGDRQIKRIIAGIPRVSSSKLIDRLNREPTLFGKFESTVKNIIVRLK
jgi:poly-beta-1,6-N-acetyl-D-glucosamine N-deacetylase